MPPTRKKPKALPMTPMRFKAKRGRVLARAISLVEALHDVEIRSLSIDSMSINYEHHHTLVWIEDREISAEFLDKIIGVANDYSASVSLREAAVNGPSKICLVVSHV